jgi:hypothetical protein
MHLERFGTSDEKKLDGAGAKGCMEYGSVVAFVGVGGCETAVL